jgi:ABC-2 type transport system permease protein
MHRLLAAIAKETLLVLRDREALVILFVMPALFVLVMSLALREPFSERAGVRFPLLIVNADDGEIGRKLVETFSTDRRFTVETRGEASAVEVELRAGKFRFAILVPPGATGQAIRRAQERFGLVRASNPPAAAVEVKLLADPTVRAESRALAATALDAALAAIETRLVLAILAETGRRLDSLRGLLPGLPVIKKVEALEVFAESLGSEAEQVPRPTSVQQSVPAYTLFAMFFLVVPLSVTFIRERSQGTLLRLQSMATPGWVVLGGKIAPYFVINQLQLLLMLLEGRYLLPLLGGDALEISGSPGGILLLAAAASLGAIGFGLAVAVFARTPEQATAFGGLTVLILSAVGGLLVPKMVMPASLQRLADFSPLSWGLEGFLDLFVRGGTAQDVLPEASALAAFGLLCFALAALRFARGFGHN